MGCPQGCSLGRGGSLQLKFCPRKELPEICWLPTLPGTGPNVCSSPGGWRLSGCHATSLTGFTVVHVLSSDPIPHQLISPLPPTDTRPLLTPYTSHHRMPGLLHTAASKYVSLFPPWFFTAILYKRASHCLEAQIKSCYSPA